MTDWVRLDRARARVRDDGIAEISHDPDVAYTAALARGHVAHFAEVLTGRAPLLVVVSSGFLPDEGARRFLLKSEEVAATFSAGAMLFGGRAEAMVVNVALRVARPVCPMKAFHREADAVAWLSAR